MALPPNRDSSSGIPQHVVSAKHALGHDAAPVAALFGEHGRGKGDAARSDEPDEGEDHELCVEDLADGGVVDAAEDLAGEKDAEGDRVEFAEGRIVQLAAAADKEAQGDDQKARQDGVDRHDHMFKHGVPPV